jgi:hypothetical protein
MMGVYTPLMYVYINGKGAVMKMTIYLPDELGETVKEAESINVSAVCQKALRRELDHRAALANADQGMERIEVEIADPGDGDDRMKVAFVGKWLVRPNEHGTRFGDDAGAFYGLALTRRQRIAVYVAHVNDRWPPDLIDYDSLDDAEEDGMPDRLIALAAGALGEDRAIELDI